MVSSYQKRRNKRRLYKVILFLFLIYPITFSALALSYLKLSLFFSPLNIISVQFSLKSPGFFSSSWQLTLHEEGIIKDGISKVDYDLTLYHGPVISKKAFEDKNLPMSKRLYPVYFDLKMSQEQLEDLTDKKIDLALNLDWKGNLSTRYENFMWSTHTVQNLFRLSNKTRLGLNFDNNQSNFLMNNTTIEFIENWTFLGHKDATINWATEHFEHPDSNQQINYLYGQIDYKTSEPRSDMTFKMEGVFQEKVAIHVEVRFNKFFTKRFEEFHNFEIDDILNDLLSNNLIRSLTEQFVVDKLSTTVEYTEPRSLRLNISLAGDGFEDFIELDYTHLKKYTLRGHVSHPTSLRYYDLFSDLERKHKIN